MRVAALGLTLHPPSRLLPEVLFQDKVGRMAVEAREAGIELPGEKGVDDEMWDMWRQRQRFRNKRDRVMMNRFQMCLDRCDNEIKWWSMDSFEREYVALELGMMSSAKFRDKLVKQAKDDVGESGGPTSSKVLHLEDKALRTVADNAVGISVYMLRNYDNTRVCEIIVETCIHVKHYRTTMVRQCRSSFGHRDWLVEQCAGGAFQHCQEGVEVLQSPARLEKMRFELPPPGSSVESIEEAMVINDDAFADLALRLVAGMFGARVSRMMFCMAWPHRMSAILSPSRNHVTECLSGLKADLEVFEQLDSMPDRSHALERMWKRHLLRQIPNQQYVRAVKEVGFDYPPHRDLLHLVTQRSTGAFTANIDEEIVGLVKNHGEVKSASRFRRPEVSMGRVLASGMLEKRFAYDFVQGDRANENRGDRLPGSAFRAEKGDWSLPFNEVQGASAQANWYSPSASNFSANLVDLTFLKDLATTSTWAAAGNAFLGKLFSFKHMFAFQYVEPGTKIKLWIFPVKHFHDSSVLAWRLKLCTSGSLSYFELEKTTKPVFATIVTLGAQDKGVQVVARSWLWQWKALPAMRKSKPAAILLFFEGTPEPVAKIACRNAGCLSRKAPRSCRL